MWIQQQLPITYTISDPNPNPIWEGEIKHLLHLRIAGNKRLNNESRTFQQPFSGQLTCLTLKDRTSMNRFGCIFSQISNGQSVKNSKPINIIEYMQLK